MMNPNVGEFVPIVDSGDTRVTSVGLKRITSRIRQHHKQGEPIRQPLRVRRRRGEQVKEWQLLITDQEERVKRRKRKSLKKILQ